MATLAEQHEPEILEPAQPHLRSLLPPTVSSSGLPVFSDVLLEVDNTERRRRRWSALLSVALQTLLVGTALIIPLMFTETLPRQQLLTFLVAPPPPPPPPPPAAATPARAVRRVESDLRDGRLRTPSKIPSKVQIIREEEAPPQLSSGGGVVGGVPGGIPGGQLGGVIGGIINGNATRPAVPRLAEPSDPKRIRVSQGVIKGLLLHKVEPNYPGLAARARVQGVVTLTAIISKNGDIENLAVVSGHPMLVPAAIDAVRQWRYRPYLLNGEPVAVETTVVVTFQLS